MKTIIGILLVMISFTSLNAQRNFIEKHLKDCQEDDNFTSINISLSGALSSEMLKDVREELGSLDSKLSEVIKDLKKMTLLTTEKQTHKYYEKVQALIKKDTYTPLIKIKEGKNSGMSVLVKESKEGVKEVLMLAGGQENFLLICFSDQ